MSRGLGPTQLPALTILEERSTGLAHAELAPMLGLKERWCRKVVASMVERDLVVVVKERRGPLVVWHVDRLGYHRQWMLAIARLELRREFQLGRSSGGRTARRADACAVIRCSPMSKRAETFRGIRRRPVGPGRRVPDNGTRTASGIDRLSRRRGLSARSSSVTETWETP